jgi:hypothetical protein
MVDRWDNGEEKQGEVVELLAMCAAAVLYRAWLCWLRRATPIQARSKLGGPLLFRIPHNGGIGEGGPCGWAGVCEGWCCPLLAMRGRGCWASCAQLRMEEDMMVLVGEI